MKLKFTRLAFLTSILFLVSCSPSTKISSSIKTSVEPPKQYQKIGIIAMVPKVENRATVEVALVETCIEKKIKAIATFGIFPFAGKTQELRKTLDEKEVKEIFKRRVNEYHLDAVLIITILDKRKETQYVPGNSFSVGIPVYGYNYYNYYSYAYSTVYSPGYYVTNSSYFVESNLYDVATEKLIWTGQTKTENPESIEVESSRFAKLIINELLSKKAIIQ